jgi:hypothetical protein
VVEGLVAAPLGVPTLIQPPAWSLSDLAYPAADGNEPPRLDAHLIYTDVRFRLFL